MNFGGPAPLVTNRATTACKLLAGLHGFLGAGSAAAFLCAGFWGTAAGSEVFHYFAIVSVVCAVGASFLFRFGRAELASDSAWKGKMLRVAVLNVVEYFTGVWGGSLCYRMYIGSAYIGTRLYFAYHATKWMLQVAIAISVLFGLSIVSTTYVALFVMTPDAVAQMQKFRVQA
eukprot:Polyplicarium_translucidae@DN5370_c0_g1_i1.p1